MAKSTKDTSTPEGQALRETGRKWLTRIEAAGKAEKNWMDDASVAVGVYTGEGSKAETSVAAANIAYDFNILFSNVETIVPAVINSPPAPDIRRRFGSDDPVAKDFAEMIERAIRVQVDDSKLQIEMEAMAQDGFLAGRGIIRMRFKSDFVGGETTDEELSERLDEEKPDYEKGDEEEAAPETDEETVTNERVTFEAVSWKDFRRGPAKRWDSVPWIAFRHSMPCDDIDEFADAKLVSSQMTAEDSTEADRDSDRDVWEVWVKKSRTVYFIGAVDGVVLKKVPDPLGLSTFFPIPTPVQAIEVTGRLMPVNPFSIYKRLADELDVTTKRIRIITKQLKVKGWYGASATDLQAVLSADDNEFVPISDPELWASKGGIEGAIAFWPIEKLIIVLTQLYQVREQTKQAIYEITGISDIVRGASKATETLGAQQLKSQWGSLRIQKMQRMIERAARDLFGMMSEVIPSKFSPETLQRMTEIQLVPTEQDMTPVQPQISPDMPPEAKQQAMEQAQQAEQARMAKLQHMQQLQELMKQKINTYYRVDVESDSTIRADLTRQKQEATEFMSAAGSYWATVGPLVKEGELPMDIAVEIFSSISRMFNLGKSVEDALDEMINMAKQKSQQPPAPPPPDPEQEARAAEMQAKTQGAQLDQKIKTDAAQTDIAIKQRMADADLAGKVLDQNTKRVDLQIKQKELEIKDVDLALKTKQLFTPPTQGQNYG
ncbi:MULTISPECIES: hypothetical protein [unclassified Mesorhizobium]|uniref:hypothetical protein n=1 Tax=unclassified Mesorhizobium TaxID=325217 RepID=UPI0030142D38